MTPPAPAGRPSPLWWGYGAVAAVYTGHAFRTLGDPRLLDLLDLGFTLAGFAALAAFLLRRRPFGGTPWRAAAIATAAWVVAWHTWLPLPPSLLSAHKDPSRAALFLGAAVVYLPLWAVQFAVGWAPRRSFVLFPPGPLPEPESARAGNARFLRESAAAIGVAPLLLIPLGTVAASILGWRGALLLHPPLAADPAFGSQIFLAAGLLFLLASSLAAARAAGIAAGRSAGSFLARPLPYLMRAAAWFTPCLLAPLLALAVGASFWSAAGGIDEARLVALDAEARGKLADASLRGRFLALGLLHAFCVYLLAPLGEELYFRRLLQAKLRRAVGPAAAILLASAAFGAAHPGYVLPAAGYGLILGLCYERERKLPVVILLHAALNVLVETAHVLLAR